jgi:hypothetical protein
MELFPLDGEQPVTHVPYKAFPPWRRPVSSADNWQALFDAPPLRYTRSFSNCRLRALGKSRRRVVRHCYPTFLHHRSGVPGNEVLTRSGNILTLSVTTSARSSESAQHRDVARHHHPRVRRKVCCDRRADVVANSPDRYREFIVSELAKWSRVINEAVRRCSLAAL